jgi:hypothetical protein
MLQGPAGRVASGTQVEKGRPDATAPVPTHGGDS